MATKHDQNKPRFELIPSTALAEVAKVMAFGAVKYGDNNWRTGPDFFTWSRLVGALLRHTFAWMRGEDLDPETGLSHIAHAACNCLFLLEYSTVGLGKDDRAGSAPQEIDKEPEGGTQRGTLTTFGVDPISMSSTVTHRSDAYVPHSDDEEFYRLTF